MSVLDDFAQIRLYRERASDFELLADAEESPNVRLRYRVVARHYRQLADQVEQADKARLTELVKRSREQRQQSAAKSNSPTENEAKFFVMAAE
jgi:hypothetical protein